MKCLPIVLASAALAARSPLLARPVNYDESKVAPYALEDPLSFADGTKLKSAADWPKRRAEILGIFAREMYGVEPPKPESVVAEIVESGETLAGLGVREQVRMWFKADRSGPHVDWLVVRPAMAKGPVPVIVQLNYYGNHEFLTDKEVMVSEAWLTNEKDGSIAITRNRAEEEQRGRLRRTDQRYSFPVETILARGYAFMTAACGEIAVDPYYKTDDMERLPFEHGAFRLWGPRDESRTDNPGTLGAWAWGLSRAVDYAELADALDAKRVVVTGCSRLGKAALLAAARDERIAVCVPNQTGNGGVPLAKRDFGENVYREMEMFPHWFCKAYRKYVDNEQAMQFDQHLLLAAIAPRALLVQGYTKPWFDPKGEWLSCRAASPAWEFLGLPGLPKVGEPECFSTVAIGPRLGYVRRTGQHGISGWDWNWLLDFADRFFGSEATCHAPRTVDLQSRIDDAAAKGGGVVRVERGEWESRPFALKSNVTLELAEGAVVYASTNHFDYAAMPRGEKTFVSAVGATNAAIVGKGVLDGRGWAFRESRRLPGESQPQDLPVMMRFTRCRNLRLEGFTYRNCGAWGCHLRNCDGVVARRLKCFSHSNRTNDGIDIESANVVVEDCDIDSGDDAVVFKTESDKTFHVTNVVVRNCRIASRCNGVKFGTGSYCDVRDVRIENCVLHRTAATPPSTRRLEFPGVENAAVGLAGLAVEVVDGGRLEDVTFRNLKVEGFMVPFFVRLGRRRAPLVPEKGTYLRNVLFENVNAVAASRIASSVTGVPGLRPQGITFRSVTLRCPGGGTAADAARPVPEMERAYPECTMFHTGFPDNLVPSALALPAWGFFVRHADDVRFEGCRLSTDEADAREPIVTDDAPRSVP